jgi:hypothetical protein
MCVSKRFKSLKIKDFKAIQQINYENTQCFGPVIKQKKDTNEEHIKEEKTDMKSKKKKSKKTKDTATRIELSISSSHLNIGQVKIKLNFVSSCFLCGLDPSLILDSL